MMKKQKTCKYCGKAFKKSPKANRIGITKYCSLLCYTKDKTKKKPYKPYKTPGKEYITVGTKQFKVVTKSPKTLSDGSKVTKQLPERDAKYLAFIRTLPCLVCKTTQAVHAHHAEFRGLGEKGSDFSCIALCENHHVNGNKSIHKLGITKFEIEHEISIADTIVKLLRAYRNLSGKY